MNENIVITEEDYIKAELNGIRRDVLERRVNVHKWSVQEAIEIPPPKNEPFKHIWEKWKTIAKRNNVTRVLFYSRVRVQGWSAERAATTKRIYKKPKYQFTKEELKTMKSIGIDKTLATMRIDKLNWTREKAVNTPRVTPEERVKAQQKRAWKKHIESQKSKN